MSTPLIPRRRGTGNALAAGKKLFQSFRTLEKFKQKALRLREGLFVFAIGY
jgi:hypothetical protein